MDRITDIDRLERQRHFEKLFQLGHAIDVILAAAGSREDDVVVAEAFGIAVTMESIGHRISLGISLGCSSCFFSTGFVILPSPILVLARSSL